MTQRVHISVPSSNIDASVSFYRSLFGTGPSKLRDDYANFRLETPPIHLAIVHAPERASEPADRHHFGVEVASGKALSEWIARLESAGVPMRREIDEACCYARADKAWLADPDGHAWELWVRTGESETLESSSTKCCVPKESESESSGCC